MISRAGSELCLAEAAIYIGAEGEPTCLAAPLRAEPNREALCCRCALDQPIVCPKNDDPLLQPSLRLLPAEKPNQVSRLGARTDRQCD
jgi:hypothetical protein